MRYLIGLVLVGLLLVAGCQVVPPSGDTANDAAAAEKFVPEVVRGYNVADATDVADALSKAGVSVGLLTGNVAMAGLVGKLDNMIQCFKGVGAVAARVYTEQNFPAAGVPKIGVLAVVNTTRIQRNILQCAVNLTGPSAQAVSEVQPCGSSGEFTVNSEKLDYLYAATTPELCAVFQQGFPAA